MRDLAGFLRRFGWSAGLRLVSAGCGFFLVIFMARRWSAELLGAYAVVYGFYALLQVAPLLGLQFAVTRNIAADPSNGTRETRAAVAIALVAAVLFCIGLGVIGQTLYAQPLHRAFWLAGLALVPTGMTVALESALMGYKRLFLMMLVNAGENVLRIASFAVIILRGGGLEAVFLAFLLLRIAAAACYLADARLRQSVRLWQVERHIVRGYLGGAATFFAILLLASAIARLDLIIFSQLGSAADIGVYSVAARLYEMTLLAPIIVTVVVFPILSRLNAVDDNHFHELVRLLLRYSFALALPCALAVAAYAGPVVGLLFSAKYAGSVPAFALLVFSTVAVAGSQTLSSMLIIKKLQRYDLYALAATAPLLTVLLLALIPADGIRGAAIAVLATNAVQFVLKYRFCRRHAGLPAMLNDFVPASVAAAGAAIVLLVLHLPPLPGMSLAAAVYLGVILVMRGVSLCDLRALQSAVAMGGG